MASGAESSTSCASLPLRVRGPRGECAVRPDWLVVVWHAMNIHLVGKPQADHLIPTMPGHPWQGTRSPSSATAFYLWDAKAMHRGNLSLETGGCPFSSEKAGCRVSGRRLPVPTVELRLPWDRLAHQQKSHGHSDLGAAGLSPRRCKVWEELRATIAMVEVLRNWPSAVRRRRLLDAYAMGY